MSVGAVVKDGQIQETASQSSVQKTSSSNGMDKDAFLQLLVAQMKYQDPLEPTSNTEYISQYATFSQVEQMQNMAASMELSRASSMVGKLVNVETTNSNGETKQIQGMVEYVTYENNKAYVS
ncbi:MAG: flagellar hook assembly protein FlgD, partial [Suilimivivens sp.]